MNETELLKQNVENKQQMTNSLRSIELQVRRSTEEAMNTMDGPRGSNLQGPYSIVTAFGRLELETGARMV